MLLCFVVVVVVVVQTITIETQKKSKPTIATDVPSSTLASAQPNRVKITKRFDEAQANITDSTGRYWRRRARRRVK